MAQSGPAPAARADALQAQDQAATEQPVANQGGTADKKKPIDRKCLQYTGSRISASDASKGKRRCISGPGSAYSKDDLDSTGQVDVGRALRNLDPSIKSN